MKVPPIMEDSLIPMHAEEETALQQLQRKRNEHWLRMRKARELWLRDVSQAGVPFNPIEFWEWLKVNFGLAPHTDKQGNITDGYDVVDEQKYLMFLLKFG